MNNKIFILEALLVLILGLTILSLFSKDEDLKLAVSELKTAKAEIENARKHIDKALDINDSLLARNKSFERYIRSIDSITRRKELQEQFVEKRLIATVEKIDRSIEKLKIDFAHTDIHLPDLPVGNLEEEN